MVTETHPRTELYILLGLEGDKIKSHCVCTDLDDANVKNHALLGGNGIIQPVHVRSRTLTEAITLLIKQEMKGLKKYGRTLDHNDTDNMDTHLSEELADGLMYITKRLLSEGKRGGV